MTGYTKKQLDKAIDCAVKSVESFHVYGFGEVRSGYLSDPFLKAVVQSALLAMGVTEFEPVKVVKYVNLYRNGPNMIHASNPFTSRAEADKEAERYEKTTHKKRIAVKKIVEGEFDV